MSSYPLPFTLSLVSYLLSCIKGGMPPPPTQRQTPPPFGSTMLGSGSLNGNNGTAAAAPSVGRPPQSQNAWGVSLLSSMSNQTT